MQTNDEFNSVALVLSGGLGLGAYQAGAFDALQRDGHFETNWLAGSSVGAVNGALIAGARPDDRIRALQDFWSAPDFWHWSGPAPPYLAHMQNWSWALYTRLFGAAGHFRPRTPRAFGPFRSLYDLSPMRDRVERLVDFGRLNSQDLRFSVATTDIQTGELIVFDTSRDRIGVDHLLASCGFLPEFAPVEIGGRLLGDGGLSANAPVELVLQDGTGIDRVFVIDLFARDGPRPASLESALERKMDLLFGNQTLQCLKAYTGSETARPVVYLSYRPAPTEAGSEKTFDLSRRSIEGRWASGFSDMSYALERLQGAQLEKLLLCRRPNNFGDDVRQSF
jgi:NTE family protein